MVKLCSACEEKLQGMIYLGKGVTLDLTPFDFDALIAGFELVPGTLPPAHSRQQPDSSHIPSESSNRAIR
jgi:hypothetical protein